MKKFFSFLLLGMLSIGTMWAGTETPGNSGTKDTQLMGTSYSIAGGFIAGAGSVQKGDMVTKGVKIRTNAGPIIISVNDGYRIDALTIYGVTNDNTKTVDINGVSVDGVDQTFTTVTIPNKSGSTSATISLPSITATNNITFSIGSNAGIQLNWDIHVTYTQTAVVTQEITAVTLNGAAISASDLATLKSSNALTIDGSALNGSGILGVTLNSGATTVNKAFNGTSAVYTFSINSGADAYTVTVTNVKKEYDAEGLVVSYDASYLSNEDHTLTANGIAFSYSEKTFGYGEGRVTLNYPALSTNVVYQPIKLSTGEGVSVTFPTGKVATKIIVYGWSTGGNGYMKTFKDGVSGTNSINTSANLFYADNASGEIYPSVYEYDVDEWEALYFECAGGQPFVVMDFVLADPTPSIKYTLINEGTLNTTDFFSTSSVSTKAEGYSIDGIDYTKYIQLGGAYTSPIGVYETNKIIRYDARTNDVKVDVYAYNKASSTDYKLYISMVEEGDEDVDDIDIQEFTITKNSGAKVSHTFTPSTNASIYIHVGNNSNVFICQAIVKESGTNLPKGGEIGYSVNLTNCRMANNKTCSKLDGIEYNATSNAVKVLTSGNPVKLKATAEYIKFTLTESERVVIAASGTYSVTSDNAYDAEAAISDNQNVDLAAGTWYINPNGSNVTFGSLSFVAQPTKFAVTFNLQGHGDAIEAQTIEDGEKVVKPTDPSAEGFAFGGWYKEAACNNAWDFENDVVTAATELFAKWTAAYAVTYYDGANELGTEAVIGGNHPTKYATYENRAHRTFVNWYNNSDLAEEHKIADISAITINADANIYGKWTVHYMSGSVDIEDFVMVNGTADTKRTELLADMTAKNIGCANYDALDKLNSEKANNNYPYLGLKFKTTGAYVDALVPAGSVLTLRVGNMAANGKVFFNGVEQNVEIVGSSSDVPADYVFNFASETLFRFETTSTGTAVLKGLYIDEEPIYRRGVVADKWNTICLPKAVAAPTGATFYEVVGKGATTISVASVTSLEAGKAYLYQNGSASLLEAEMSGAASTAVANNGLHGNLNASPMDVTANAGNYILVDNEFHEIQTGATATIAQYRAYLTLSEVTTATPAPGRDIIRIPMSGQGATNIDNLEGVENAVKFFQDGKLYILRDGVVYDAMGKMVR